MSLYPDCHYILSNAHKYHPHFSLCVNKFSFGRKHTSQKHPGYSHTCNVIHLSPSPTDRLLTKHGHHKVYSAVMGTEVSQIFTTLTVTWITVQYLHQTLQLYNKLAFPQRRSGLDIQKYLFTNICLGIWTCFLLTPCPLSQPLTQPYHLLDATPLQLQDFGHSGKASVQLVIFTLVDKKRKTLMHE